MAGTFDKHGPVYSALCVNTQKAMDWLEANLTQEQLTALEAHIVPRPTQAEKAQKLYAMGNLAKEIGIADCAAALKTSEETLISMLMSGTATADTWAASVNPLIPEGGASNGESQ